MINTFANLPHLQITSKQKLFFVVAIMFQVVATIMTTKNTFIVAIVAKQHQLDKHQEFIG